MRGFFFFFFPILDHSVGVQASSLSTNLVIMLILIFIL